METSNGNFETMTSGCGDILLDVVAR